MTRPSELDWSDPHKTPRFDPSKASACREGVSPPVQTPSRPLTGSLADYDDLSQAVRTYRATYGRWAYEALRDAATRCGMPSGEPPLSWAVARLNTYRNMIGA